MMIQGGLAYAFEKIWAVIYAVMLATFSTFVLLDAFVIPKERIKADEPIQSQEITDESIEAKAEAVITENSYKDDKISITISELREYDTSIYVADIQLAQIMKGQDCVTAYNLDGGGSSTMWFNGEVVNKPTSYGSKISERAVSDIVYIGR